MTATPSFNLLEEVGTAHTGSDILLRLETFASLSREDSETFLEVIAKNRFDQNTKHFGDVTGLELISY